MEGFLGAVASWWEGVVGIAKSFQLKDAVDILIIGLLIYGAIKLVRETRAGQLVKGLLLLVLLFFISSNLHLVMVNQMLYYVFQFALVAILIVFQPEIRKALEQMGRSSNMSRSIADAVGARDKDSEKQRMRKAINSIVDGVGILQQLKMGALIVFERKTKLGDIIETGTQINCEPSGQIVGNIFFNKAPLHDGAMIIRDGMIHAAGCILPLTKNASVSAELGTRHRAALGVTEMSDAIALVVSEERGEITAAVAGHFSKPLSEAQLKKICNHYFSFESKESNFMDRLREEIQQQWAGGDKNV